MGIALIGMSAAADVERRTCGCGDQQAACEAQPVVGHLIAGGRSCLLHVPVRTHTSAGRGSSHLAPKTASRWQTGPYSGASADSQAPWLAIARSSHAASQVDIAVDRNGIRGRGHDG